MPWDGGESFAQARLVIAAWRMLIAPNIAGESGCPAKRDLFESDGDRPSRTEQKASAPRLMLLHLSATASGIGFLTTGTILTAQLARIQPKTTVRGKRGNRDGR